MKTLIILAHPNFDNSLANKTIINELKSNDEKFNEPSVPFAPGTLIRDYNDLYYKIYDKTHYTTYFKNTAHTPT